MGACIKMFVVANCLGGVIEAGIQVEMLNTLTICHTVEPPLSGLLLSGHLHCPDSPNWSCGL